MSSPPGGASGERIALASGSQPAVVKLVSFAAGRARLGKLLTYQSRGGELAVENEAGATSEGRDWIGQLADEWSEADGREPSKDVLRLSMTVDASRFADDAAVGEALKDALAGHRIAWRSVESADGAAREIELVVSAARRRQPGEERAGRIYDNRKSLSALDDGLTAAFGPDTVVDVHGFAHGVEGVSRYLGQLSKGGSHRVIVNRINRSGQPGADDVLEGDRSALDEAKEWKRDLRSQERRDVAHIVLSARPGTPKDAFVDAARAMLAREFAGHRYLFTTHEDRRHIHVHAVVKMQSETGERLHPKIEDLRRWRRTIAEEARERDIPMDAVSRFERANPPGYKMKDIRRVERGEASENTRRRVEAVRDGIIHIPSRNEGKRHAQAVAIGWNGEAERVAATPYRPEPKQRPGVVRLYRAERQDARSSAPLFTRDRHVAAQRVVRDGGALRYIDVPLDAVQMLTPSRQDPENVFVVPRALAASSKVIDVTDPALVRNFRDRAAVAVAQGRETAAEQNMTTTKPATIREQDMPDLNVMNNAFTEMETSLDQIGQNLPPERLQEFDGLRKKLKVSQTKMLETQTNIEKKRGSIEGETYVTPVPHQFAGFVAEKRGEDVRYNHRKTDGRVGAVAFTDHGDRVEIGNWRDREVVLAAMQLGAEKWGALTVNGTDRYKSLAVELAAEHGFRLTNPELQDALVAARDRLASQRPKEASITAGGSTPTETKVETQKANPTPAGTPTQETAAAANAGEAAKPAPTFVDAGDKIRLSDRDRAAMLSAMQEAAKKWNTIAVTGSDEDKALAVELAAEHGFRITNPELQDQLKAAQAVVEERRAREEALEQQKLGFVDGAKIAKETASAQTATAPVEMPKLPVDTGDKVKPADRGRDSMLVAMRAASEKWGTITVNGTDREKAVAVELAAEHGIAISNPELQDQVKAAQAKVEDRRAKEEARERKQLGFVAGTNEAVAAQRTDAEIAIALDTVKENTRAEAVRETRQAQRSERTNERPFDGGGEDHAFRTKAESAAARRAERSVEQNPATPIPTDINQSPEIERQRQVQDELLSEKEANKQARAPRQRQKPRQKQ
ncbi:LPD7 domain-containing protein [Rhizobium sp. NPDC090275]|uniref:LPD7 domain-containing protein n=1 Tax=Rhizobium sp. NPDC090275 TaxID=3364498 RepID=UPI00383B096D